MAKKYSSDEMNVWSIADEILDLIRHSENIGDDVDRWEFRDKIVAVILGREDD